MTKYFFIFIFDPEMDKYYMKLKIKKYNKLNVAILWFLLITLLSY